MNSDVDDEINFSTAADASAAVYRRIAELYAAAADAWRRGEHVSAVASFMNAEKAIDAIASICGTEKTAKG